jgi:hypothetical protein
VLGNELGHAPAELERLRQKGIIGGPALAGIGVDDRAADEG